MQQEEGYPFAGYSFQLEFLKHDEEDVSDNHIDDAFVFQEISGLSVSMSTEETKESKENNFAHRMPSRPKYGNLVLKRGLSNAKDRKILGWAQDSIGRFSFNPKALRISLVDNEITPLAIWKVINAYPVAIKVSELKSIDNPTIIETLELAFDYFERIK